MFLRISWHLMGMDGVQAGRAGWWRKAAGWGLLVAGVAGCVLPVAPGIPLVLAGLVVLGRDYHWARQTLQWVKRWVVRMRRKGKSA